VAAGRRVEPRESKAVPSMNLVAPTPDPLPRHPATPALTAVKNSKQGLRELGAHARTDNLAPTCTAGASGSIWYRFLRRDRQTHSDQQQGERWEIAHIDAVRRGQ
jgi:hypothetical protein